MSMFKQISSAVACTLIGFIIAGVAIHQQIPTPTPVPSPIPCPTPCPPAVDPSVGPVGIAAQKQKLRLSDGRSATFKFAVSAGTLQATAAIGLDQVVCYALVPIGEPGPEPRPIPPAPPVVVPPVVPPKPIDPEPIPNPTQAVAANAIVVFSGTDKPWEASEVTEAAKAAGISIVAFDVAKSHDLHNAPGWLSYGKSKGLPWVALVDDPGKVLWEGKADDPKILSAAIKAFAGKPAPPKKSGRWERQCGPNGCKQVWVEN